MWRVDERINDDVDDVYDELEKKGQIFRKKLVNGEEYDVSTTLERQRTGARRGRIRKMRSMTARRLVPWV